MISARRTGLTENFFPEMNDMIDRIRFQLSWNATVENWLQVISLLKSLDREGCSKNALIWGTTYGPELASAFCFLFKNLAHSAPSEGFTSI